KMFDFMAMGLPVISTAIGARGIECGRRRPIMVVEPSVEGFTAGIEHLKNSEIRANMARDARLVVEEGYAWERISNQLGCFVQSRIRLAAQPRPYFSVVVPTYERHEQLYELVRHLSAQVERDFEVIVIDQSEE